MKKSRRLINSLKLIGVILVLSIAIFIGFYIKEKKNPISLFFNRGNIEISFDDNINGIYNYKEQVSPNKAVYVGCQVNAINNYILIINDNYRVFRSTCVGTYLKEEGNIDDLDIKQDGDDYYIEYKEHRYDKDNLVKTIIPENTVSKTKKNVEISNIQFLMEESEFEGNYYPLKNNLVNNNKLAFNYTKKADDVPGKESFSISSQFTKSDIYSFQFEKYDEFPYLQSFGKMIVVIEKKDNPNNNMKYGYRFLVLDETGVIYNLDQMFPIAVNNETLTLEDNSVYVMYDAKERIFRLFVGYNKKMCVEDSDQHRPIFYEFRIKYNYTNNQFEKPEFYKVGYEDEKCSYIRNYVNGG